ncbi:uncharacterized protein NECHADRAFT_97619 [Fusarium vanettenii 77-13-4]|uniref:Major facilitator superfamily (MFS) profile domain-containing protein n=1 Tax=Fusarium vanettenii (strain ATCC MYA-4622 / CBS 123669 / FGSC 9596 / NRRL 45880 / 77-13-4) TaxID=660122 RepID=C7ZE45_FUSV7|nr:uncharacterized protein NECHADRAFT_97619 [Fusarium vanettenii 77-13-4]EEU37540.1 hypothetical protein NECHADRAFT_97619 [Fusarium vanettenii 77-13-4]
MNDTTTSNDSDYDPNIIAWNGPDDPENPMNWSPRKKWMNIALMSLLTIISISKGSSMFAPGVAKIMVEFNSTSSLLATFVVSIYFIGYAFGPLVFAPLSEIYGRVYIYHGGNSAFVLVCVGAALSHSMGMLLALRFLMGIFGSAPTTVGVGSIIDVVDLEWRGRAVSIWAMGPLLGPCVGPVVGGYVVEYIGWRWVYWILAIMGGVLGIVGLLLMRETYAPTLLERKVRRLRSETGNQSLRSKMDTRSHKLVKLAIIRPIKFLIKTPMVTIIALYVSIAYGILNLLIATFSFVYADQYNFSEGTLGLSFLPAGIGMMIGVLSYGNLADYLVQRSQKDQQPGTAYRPEVKLAPWATVPVGFAFCAGMFIYGWTTEERVHWIVPMLAVAVLCFGLMGATASLMSLQNYQIDSYPAYASSGSAAITLFRSLVGGLLPLSGLRIYDSLGLGWGNTVLGLIAVSLIPVPVLLYFYGERLRKRYTPTL